MYMNNKQYEYSKYIILTISDYLQSPFQLIAIKQTLSEIERTSNLSFFSILLEMRLTTR